MARDGSRTGAPAVGSQTHSSDTASAHHAGEAGVVPQVLLGAVDGVGVVAGGLLQLTRNVLLTAVSGAADIGAEALNATVSGARGVVSATSRMVGDMAGTARSTFVETVSLASHARGRASGRVAARRPPAAMASRATPSDAAQPSRPGRRARAAIRPARSRPAA